MSMTSFDIVMENRKKLVEKIIENMKNGYVIPPDQWEHGSVRPHNPVSNVFYRGGNMIRLMYAADEKGYQDTRWLTFKQAKEKGYKVKKGEESTLCEKWIFTKEVKVKDESTGDEVKQLVKLKKPMVKYFRVFNAEQLDGIEPLPIKAPLVKNEVLEIAENFIKSSECSIHELKQDRAYYSCKKDIIVLPERNMFRDQESFLGTALHEMAHSTGHPTRLNRPLMNLFGSPEYAMEELRAELTSYFIESDLGIHLQDEHFNSHTQYLQSWIKALSDDPNELFRACADAEHATNRLISNYERYLESEHIELKARVNDSNIIKAEADISARGLYEPVENVDIERKKVEDTNVTYSVKLEKIYQYEVEQSIPSLERLTQFNYNYYNDGNVIKETYNTSDKDIEKRYDELFSKKYLVASKNNVEVIKQEDIEKIMKLIPEETWEQQQMTISDYGLEQ